MKIIKILSKNRNDFKAIFQCEHCGEEKETKGYDDSYFYETVMPNMKCAKCGVTKTKQSSKKQKGA